MKFEITRRLAPYGPLLHTHDIDEFLCPIVDTTLPTCPRLVNESSCLLAIFGWKALEGDPLSFQACPDELREGPGRRRGLPLRIRQGIKRRGNPL